MLWRTPTAIHILLRPGVHFKPIKCNALLTDWNLRQTRPNFPVESVLVHAQVAGSIAQTDESREKNGHVPAPQIHRSYLLPDMTQLLVNIQESLLITQWSRGNYVLKPILRTRYAAVTVNSTQMCCGFSC
jgi:hypothetical protein